MGGLSSLRNLFPGISDMLDGAAFEIVRQGFRALVVAGAPVLIAASVAGILMAVLQSATNIHDSASAYAARLLGICIVFFLMYQSIWMTLTSLMELALH